MESSQISTETLFWCLPLRLGVLVTSTVCFITSLFYVFDRQDFQYEFRHMVGGYGTNSRVAVGAVEWIGVIATGAGIVGVWYQKFNHVLTFAMWMGLRLIAWIYVYAVDIPILSKCEDWVENLDQMEKDYGWNQLMYDIAMDADCPHERLHFFFWSLIFLATFMYVTWGVARYLEITARVPKHLLRVQKDLPSGAFYATSSGERSALNSTGIWRKSMGSGMIMASPPMPPVGIPPPAMPGMPPPGMVPPPGAMGPMGMPPPGMPQGPMGGMPMPPLGAMPPTPAGPPMATMPPAGPPPAAVGGFPPNAGLPQRLP